MMPSRERPLSRSFSRRVIAFAAMVVFALAALFMFPTANPKTLFQQSQSERNPETQINLLHQALDASNGNFPKAESRLCLLLCKAQRWDEVEQLLSHSDVAKWPEYDRMAFAEHCVKASRRKLLEHLAAVLPNEARHWWQLAGIHEQLDDTVAAIRTYDAALNQNIPASEQLAMRHQLLDHCIDIGELTRAQELLHLLVSQGESGPQVDVYRARVFHLEGQPADALAALNSALREIGDHPEGLRLRGILYLELGQLSSAIKDFRRVTAMAPHDEITHFKLAEAYRRLGQRDRNDAMLKLAESTHNAYLKHHKRNLRLAELGNRLKQAPDDQELHFEVQRLRAEIARETPQSPR